MIKGILFDFDGTLVNTDQVIFKGYKYLFDTYKPGYQPTEEEYNSFLGPALKDVFPKYFKEDVNFLIEDYRKHSYPFLTKENVKLHKGVYETLSAMKKHNLKCAIVTSRQHESAINLLQMLELESFFDVIVGYDDVKEVKPDPAPFNKCLTALNLKADEVIMVGDHYSDIVGGKNSKIYPVGVSWSSMGADCLRKLGALAIIDDMRELFSLIEELNKNDL